MTMAKQPSVREKFLQVFSKISKLKQKMKEGTVENEKEGHGLKEEKRCRVIRCRVIRSILLFFRENDER